MSKIGLSVIIPVYNSELWIEPTINHIVDALKGAAFQSEIIVIDDGSTDKSSERAKATQATSAVKLLVIAQANEGRYLARARGVDLADYDNIFIADSRVYLDQGCVPRFYRPSMYN